MLLGYGAGVANVLISLIATAYAAEENVYEYLLALQKYSEQVKVNPADWLPWRYEQTIELMKAASSCETAEA